MIRRDGACKVWGEMELVKFEERGSWWCRRRRDGACKFIGGELELVKLEVESWSLWSGRWRVGADEVWGEMKLVKLEERWSWWSLRGITIFCPSILWHHCFCFLHFNSISDVLLIVTVAMFVVVFNWPAGIDRYKQANEISSREKVCSVCSASQ